MDPSESTTRHQRSLSEIPGWLNPTDALLFEWLLTVAGPESGDLLEIGVYQGKTAIHIGKYRRPGEKFTVCDLFDLARDEMSIRPGARKAYRDLTQELFEKNYLTFHTELPTIVRAHSEHIVDYVAPSSVRFAHIDGSHLYVHVRRDLLSARQLLRPDGIVAFDDYRTEHCPGTAAAIWEGVIRDDLRIVCVSANKFYATWGDPAPVQKVIIDQVERRDDLRIDQQDVLGQSLLRVVRVTRKPAGRSAGPARTVGTKATLRHAAKAVLPPLVLDAARKVRLRYRRHT